MSPTSNNINISWYNLINSLLIVLNDSYITEENNKKKILINGTSELLKDKISNKINCDNFSDAIKNETSRKSGLTKIAKNLDICLGILEANTMNLYNLKNYEENDNTKFVIIYKFNDYYFPFINWKEKYYTHNSNFIKELIFKFKRIEDATNKSDNIEKEEKIKKKDKTNKKDKINKEDKIKSNSKNKLVDNIIKSDKDIIKSDKDVNNDGENNGKYKEFMTNDKSALFMSEAVTLVNNKKKIKKNNSTINEICTENTTVKMTSTQKREIIKDTIKSMTLVGLQTNALKIGLEIVYKDKKTGKLKNKTKLVLYDEIKSQE